MSNLTVVNGSSVNVDINAPSSNTITAVSQPVTKVSVAGIVRAGDAHYIHTQLDPEMIWTVTHNLNKKPSITVVDSSDAVVVGEVEYLSNNSIRLTFVGAFSGKAYFN